MINEALFKLAGHDGRAVFPFSESAFLRVQTQIHHARVLVGTVALEAIVGENGTDLTLKIDWRGRFSRYLLRPELQRQTGGAKNKPWNPLRGPSTASMMLHPFTFAARPVCSHTYAAILAALKSFGAGVLGGSGFQSISFFEGSPL